MSSFTSSLITPARLGVIVGAALLVAPAFARAEGTPLGFYAGFPGGVSNGDAVCAIASAYSDYDILDNRVGDNASIATQLASAVTGTTVNLAADRQVNVGTGGDINFEDVEDVDGEPLALEVSFHGAGLNRATENAFPSVATQCDDSDSTFKVFVGYNVRPWLGFELSWADFGEAAASTSGRSSFRAIRIDDGHITGAAGSETLRSIQFVNRCADIDCRGQIANADGSTGLGIIPDGSDVGDRRELRRPGQTGPDDPDSDAADLAYNEVGTADWYDVPDWENDGQVRLATTMKMDRSSIGLSALFRYRALYWVTDNRWVADNLIPYFRLGVNFWDVEVSTSAEALFETGADVSVCTRIPNNIRCDSSSTSAFAVGRIPEGTLVRAPVEGGGFTESGTGLLVGLGAEFYVSPKTSLRFGVERYFASGDVKGHIAEVLASENPSRDFAPGTADTAFGTRGASEFDEDIDLWEFSIIISF